MDRQLRITTLGRFQISGGDQLTTDIVTRHNKMWSVMKYLIAHYGKPVPAEKLAEEFCSDDDCDDPAKVLRNIIYRLRKALAAHGGEKPYIIFDKGNYSWNPEVDCRIDALEFSRLIDEARDGSKPAKERIVIYNRAMDLYDGPFLGGTATEIWTLVFTNFYRRLFLQAVGEFADLLEEESMLDEAIMLFDKAIGCEPFEEPLYIRQIQTMISNGEYVYARQQYRHFEKILMREFGTKPSQSLERLYYEIEKATVNEPGDIDEITEVFEAGNKKRGAFFCGPETFRQIYILDKRSEERIQFPVFLALITFILPPDIDDVQREGEMRSAMKTLRQLLVASLRNGDVIAQYSKSQFVLMLTALNYEGGTAALRRLKYLFEGKFGKNRATFEFDLAPIGREHMYFDFGEMESRKTPQPGAKNE